MQQFFAIKINDEFRLKDEDLHHLVTVLRASKDKEIVCIYDDESYLCLFNGDKDKYKIDIIHKISRDSELDSKIILYQALIRNENFDLVLQKAVELGVSAIVPTVFSRNVVKIEASKEDSKIERYKKIVIGASQQSRRIVVPTVERQINVKDINLKDGEIGLVCYEKNEDTSSLISLESDIKNAKYIKVVIGPEGGISEDEYQTLLQKGFKSITLGKRILRSETAAFNILSVLGYILEAK